MSKRSELRAINRAKKKGVDLVDLTLLKAQKRVEQEAEWREWEKKEREASRLHNISMSMRLYTAHRHNLLTKLTGVYVGGKLRKPAVIFNQAIFFCDYPSRFNPFQIHGTLGRIFRDIEALYSKFRFLEDRFNGIEDTQDYHVKINIDNVLNYALEYFPRWGLESCTEIVRKLFDEYQRQLPLSEKWDAVLKAEWEKNKQNSMCYLQFTYGSIEQLVERFYQENRAEIDALNN
jgi:hypothetical protein